MKANYTQSLQKEATMKIRAEIKRRLKKKKKISKTKSQLIEKISNIIKILVKLAKRKKRIDANKVRNEPREITNGVIDIKRIT